MKEEGGRGRGKGEGEKEGNKSICTKKGQCEKEKHKIVRQNNRRKNDISQSKSVNKCIKQTDHPIQI